MGGFAVSHNTSVTKQGVLKFHTGKTSDLCEVPTFSPIHYKNTCEQLKFHRVAKFDEIAINRQWHMKNVIVSW